MHAHTHTHTIIIRLFLLLIEEVARVLSICNPIIKKFKNKFIENKKFEIKQKPNR